jgi:4-hydroxybenzoate polyprenyltransferase
MSSIATQSRHKIRTLLEAIKFEHTIFALPFAYLGMVLAARGLPTLWQFIWITVAMAGARSLAMALNRLIDAGLDALNPRTANRAIPKKLIKPGEMLAFAIISGIVLAFAAWQLNALAFRLLPLAVVFLVGYSYTKRFTWLCHFFLGLTDGIAPIGGWIAVNPTWSAQNLVPPLLLGIAVALWVGGFDLIYSCQDIEFDRAHGLHSIPARFGPAAALRTSEVMHVLTAVVLLAVGIMLHLGWIYWLGWLGACALLVQEHRLVNPRDFSQLDVAFFNMNSYIALVVFVAAFAAIYIH